MNSFDASEGERRSEHGGPDVHPLGGPNAPRCAECDRVMVDRRADARWCSARCRMRWKRKQQRLEEARASYSAVHPDISLTDLHAQTTRYRSDDDPGDLDDGQEEDDEYGLHAGNTDDDNDDEADASWNDEWVLRQRLDRLWDEFVRQSEPYLKLLGRNPGVYPPEAAELHYAYVTQSGRLIREHENAKARSQAERDKFKRIARAQEEMQARQALAGFAADMGRGRRVDRNPYQWHGRETHDLFRW